MGLKAAIPKGQDNGHIIRQARMSGQIGEKRLAMHKLKSAVKWLTPPILLAIAKGLLRPRSVPAAAPPEEPAAPFYGYQGDYPDWAAATAVAEGYQAANILDIQRDAMRKIRDGEAVYERDSVLFDTIEYSYPLLAALLLVASRCGGKLSVLDFGGALGSSYYQNRQMLSHLSPLHWHVVEQPHFVAAGHAEFEYAQLRFFPTVGAAWDAVAPDVVLLSSVLQYLENPGGLLREIADRGAPYILIDRTLVLEEGPERIVLQTVPPGIYAASYACRLFAPGAIEAVLAPDYEPCFSFAASVGGPIDVGTARAHHVGMLFQRRARD
jgi:putative methyltransferase (TIGR04325 family)